jgi:hypothetical protein
MSEQGSTQVSATAQPQVTGLADPQGTAEGKYDAKGEVKAQTEQITEEELEELEARGKKYKLNKARDSSGIGPKRAWCGHRL